MTTKITQAVMPGLVLLAGLLFLAMLLPQACIADGSGYWAFRKTEVETPSKEDLGKHCSYKGDGNRSGLLGLAHFETKCYSAALNATATYSGNMAWGYHTQFDRPQAEFNQGLDVLIPGKLIGFAITATSTSQANGASAWVSMGTTHPHTGSVSVGGTPVAPAGGKAVGKGYAKVFGKPVPLPNGKTPLLVLEFVVSGGNAQQDIKVRYLYDWIEGLPVQGPPETLPEPSQSGSFLGCYKDAWDRDLAGYTFNDPGMTTQKCIAACSQRGFAYAATQYASHCFCANGFGKHGKASNCDMPCGGNKAEICGGSFANSVYQLIGGGVGPLPSPPLPSLPRLEGTWRAVAEARGLDKVGYQITQDGRGNLTFTAPDGKRSKGHFVGTESVEATDWGVKGSLSSDGDTINWDNGSRWTRSARAPSPKAKSLTGAWVHSADGTTQTRDSKVIVLHEGNQVTLLGTYKMEANRNQWQTYRCVGQLSGSELPVQCRWVEGGNPMSYGDTNWSMTFQVSPDRDHLDYRHTRPEPGQDSHYSRVP